MPLSEKLPKKYGGFIWVAGIGVLMMVAWTVLVLSRSEQNELNLAAAKPSNHLHRSGMIKDQVRPGAIKVARSELATRSSSAQRVASSEQADGSSMIGDLIGNEALSHDELAKKLALIALDPKISEEERLEAMEHGKNLGFSHLLPLSSDPNLPILLADSYLNGLHRHDQPKEQVTGALGLLNHNDPEIRQQAQTLIGFLIGAEEDNESPDKLREKANAFLNQLEEGDGEVIGQ